MAASDRDSGVSAPSKDSDRMLVGMNLYYFEEKYHEPEEFA